MFDLLIKNDAQAAPTEEQPPVCTVSSTSQCRCIGRNRDLPAADSPERR